MWHPLLGTRLLPGKREYQYLNPCFNDCNASVLTNTILDKDKTWYNHIHYHMSMGQVNTEVIGLGSDTIISETIYDNV